jgi:hypothetical protein
MRDYCIYGDGKRNYFIIALVILHDVLTYVDVIKSAIKGSFEKSVVAL